jgi:hypothetical protein
MTTSKYTATASANDLRNMRWQQLRHGALIIATIGAPLLLASQESTPGLSTANAELGEGFERIASVRELSDGRVLMTNHIDFHLSLADFQTGLTRRIGTVGDGPSEYRRAGWLFALGGDTTIMTDLQTRHWFVLNGGGIVQVMDNARGSAVELLGPDLRGSDASGHVLGVRGEKFSARALFRGAEEADSLALVIAGRATSNSVEAVFDTVARIRGRGLDLPCAIGGRGGRATPSAGQPARSGAERCNPLASEDLPLLFRDGWLAIVLREPYRVDWRSPDGSWVRGRPLPFTQVRLTSAAMCAVQRNWPLGDVPDCPSQTLARFDWPAFLPATFRNFGGNRDGIAPSVARLFATPEGHLVVHRTSIAPALANRYDVVDRRGALLRTITLPRSEWIVGYGARSVYTVRVDSLDLQWLRRHPWPR